MAGGFNSFDVQYSPSRPRLDRLWQGGMETSFAVVSSLCGSGPKMLGSPGSESFLLQAGPGVPGPGR